MTSFTMYFNMVTTILCIVILNIFCVFSVVNKPKLNALIDGTALLRHRRALPSSQWKLSKKEIKQMFEEYYKCTYKANKDAKTMSDTITAVLALEGQRIDLPCPICIRPDQKPRARWQRVRTVDSSVQHIHNEHGIKIKKDKTLVIKHVDIMHAGQYFCVQGSDALAIYQLDVFFKEPQRTVYENNTKTLLHSQRLVDHNLKVFTKWSEWGECDNCGKPGRRLRYGTCMVQKMYTDKPSLPIDIPILKMYPNGVPCRSTVLVREMANLKGIGDRKSEMVVEDHGKSDQHHGKIMEISWNFVEEGTCNVSCPTVRPPIRVTNKRGRVVQIIEGGYHPMEKKPVMPPLVIRKVRHEKQGSHLILKCPTSNKGKIRWQRGKRAINPATIRRQTRGRVFVDRLNRLHIRKLRRHDSAPYNCWVWQEHIATTKVIVYKGFDENIKHYITYAGLFMTVIALPIFCIFKLFCRKRKRPSRTG